jgi:hypothetical protein
MRVWRLATSSPKRRTPMSKEPLTLTIKQRVKLIRAATPNGDTLLRLYEMSNQNCDLCPFPIQDLMLAALDHSTPVIFFARSPMPIEDAIAQANDPKNLRCAHALCNSTKKDLTREEWFSRGLDKTVGQPRSYTDVELLELQFRLGAGGRKSVAEGLGIFAPGYNRSSVSRINGRKTKERSVGIFAPEMRGVGGRISGRVTGPIQGRKNVESGHIYQIATPESCAKAGRKGGRKTAAIPGHLAAINLASRGLGVAAARKKKTGLFAPDKAIQAAGGRVSGRNHKEKGDGIFAPGVAAAGGRIGGRKNAESGQVHEALHIRWHVKRGIVNPNCEWCQKQQAAA